MTIPEPGAHDPATPVRHVRSRLIVGAGAVVAAAVFAAGYLIGDHSGNSRHAAGVQADAQAGHAGMQQRAAQVMPFDLSVTTHTFTKDAGAASNGSSPPARPTRPTPT